MDTQNVTKRVSEYMKKHHMAEAGDGILAAVSGGADSVCLLLVLEELAEELGIRLAAFHMNHGIRGAEADRDEEYVRKLCAERGILLKVVREDVQRYAEEEKLSEEEAGRILRYRHLKLTAEEFGCKHIATAHHRDDQVETVLMNLFRGSGLKGLGGIRPVRDNIIRPLLHLTRQEIEAYLYKKKVIWCDDSTNRENVYKRNKVRNVLMPWVQEEINDQASAHIVKTAEFAQEADVYFAELAEKILSECGTYDAGNVVKFPVEIFDSQPRLVKTYLVRAMIRKLTDSEKDISTRHIEAVCALCGPGGGTEVDLPHGLRCVRGYEQLEIQKRGAQDEIHRSDTSVFFTTRTFPWEKDLEISKNQYTKWFDYDKIKGTLFIRTREPGDYFMIGDEKRKLLKRFFIDEKIPEAERGEIPLLAEGNHILWIVGYRISDYYKITDSTRTVLEVRLYEGEENG